MKKGSKEAKEWGAKMKKARKKSQSKEYKDLVKATRIWKKRGK